MSRNDNVGNKLRTGESQRPDGRYRYRWQENGKQQEVCDLTLDGLREKERNIKRKDKNGKNLNTGECQRKDGRYMYRWTENGKENTVYALSLEELRIKEAKIQNSNTLNKEIQYIKKSNDKSEVVAFIEFFKQEIPGVYKRLYQEFKKRKEIAE